MSARVAAGISILHFCMALTDGSIELMVLDHSGHMCTPSWPLVIAMVNHCNDAYLSTAESYQDKQESAVISHHLSTCGHVIALAAKNSASTARIFECRKVTSFNVGM